MGIGRNDAPNYSPEEVDRALAAWLRLGSSDAAERETGVPAATLRATKHRHPDRFREIQVAFEQELRENRRAIASSPQASLVLRPVPDAVRLPNVLPLGALETGHQEPRIWA